MQADINAMADVLRTEFGADWRITSGNCANCGNSGRRRKREGGLGKLLVHRLQCLGREGAHVGDAIVRFRAQGARDLALGADDGDPGGSRPDLRWCRCGEVAHRELPHVVKPSCSA